MSRRGRRSPAEDLFDLVALLPWWAGVALAALAYLVLHSIASQQVTHTPVPGQMGGAVSAMAFRSLASVGQYILPLICLFAAIGSAIARHRRRTLIANVSASDAANPLDGMTWREFELLVGEAFRMRGYRVSETGGGGADGGVDLVLRKEHETHLVQCKQWRAARVGVTVVRELYGVITARGAAGGFIVTSGRFSREATEFARGCNVKLIEGPALMGLIKQAQSARVGAVPEAQAPRPVVAPAATDEAPQCPKCGARMVKRMANRGANAGGAFWGCGTYPDCRGIRAVG